MSYMDEDRETYGKYPYGAGRGRIETVIRYVITHVSEKDPELRVLTLSAQGRYTYATREEAVRRMRDLLKPDGLPHIMSVETLGTVEVRPVLCWAGHHDPVRTVFPIDGNEEA